MATDVVGMATDVAGMATDVTDMATDVAGMATNVAGMATDVAGIILVFYWYNIWARVVQLSSERLLAIDCWAAVVSVLNEETILNV